MAGERRQRRGARGRQRRRRELPGPRWRRSRGEARGWLMLPASLGLAAAMALAGCAGGAHHAAAPSPAAPSPAATAPAPAVTATPAVTQTSVGAADWYCLSAPERRAMFLLHGPGRDR